LEIKLGKENVATAFFCGDHGWHGGAGLPLRLFRTLAAPRTFSTIWFSPGLRTPAGMMAWNGPVGSFSPTFGPLMKASAPQAMRFQRRTARA
jgi:hypothetical protein